MAEEESIQYHIEFQEGTGGNNGEVIIIYNCENGELTPELLASTLTELSKQAALQQQSTNQTHLSSGEGGSKRNGQGLEQIDMETLEVEQSGVKQEDITSNNLVTTVQLDDLQEAFGIEHAGKDVQVIIHNPSADVNGDLGVPENSALHIHSLEQMSSSSDLQLPMEAKFKLTNIESKSSECKPTDGELNDKSDKGIKSEVDCGFSESDGSKQMDNVVLSSKSCDNCSYAAQTEIELMRHRKNEHKDEEPFWCVSCGRRFRLELSLQIHSMSHDNESDVKLQSSRRKKWFTCPLCSFEYYHKTMFTHHLKKEHKGAKVFRCSKCIHVCLSDEDLENHMASPSHDESLKQECTKCGVLCKDLKRHDKVAHCSYRPYLCTLCGFRAKCLANLKAHIITHSSEKNVECPICDYKCRMKGQLDKHMLRHTSDKSYKCPVDGCPFACKSQSSLKRHSQIHLSDNKYVCTICDFCTRDKLDLKKHKLTEHPRNASFECKDCNLSFSRVAELKTHALAVHRTTKVCFCAYCDFSCETNNELRIHMQSHYGKYSYSCKVCGYTCRLSSLYKRHMGRHFKAKNFKCSACSYACSEKSDLKKHILSKHSQDKPFECPHCNYKCKFQTRLNNHIACVHTDVKPYFCNMCSYSAKSAENLKKHIGTHTGLLKTIQCMLCDYATSEKAKLRRHMQVHVKRVIFQQQ